MSVLVDDTISVSMVLDIFVKKDHIQLTLKILQGKMPLQHTPGEVWIELVGLLYAEDLEQLEALWLNGVEHAFLRLCFQPRNFYTSRFKLVETVERCRKYKEGSNVPRLPSSAVMGYCMGMRSM